MDNKKPKNITEAIRHLEALTHEHVGTVGKDVEKIMQDVQKTLEDLKPMVEDFESKARTKIHETTTRVKEKVKQDPWIVVVAVAIIGFILGLLYLKSREDE